MALRFQPRAEHDHWARWLACLALAAAALILPAAGSARATPASSDSSGMILVAPPLQVNSAGHGSPSFFSLRPFSEARRTDGQITVTTPDDALPNANECSGAGGTAPFGRRSTRRPKPGPPRSSSPNNYTVTLGTLLVNTSLTFLGTNPATTTIDGSRNVNPANNQLSRIMKIGAGQTVSLANLTMTGGVDDNDENFSGGAVSTVSLNGGGAIFNNGGTLTLASVVFSNNAANNPIGGAIATTGGSLGMTNVTFAGNAAGVAGALRIRSGTVAGIGVTFSTNNGEFGGGSIYIDGGSLNLTNSTIDGSAA